MKQYLRLGLVAGLLATLGVACEKEQPAENIAGSYTGVLSGTYDDNDTIIPSYALTATASTTNKVLIEASYSMFPSFEVLVSQNGINVVPVSTDNEVYQFLYQGDLKELTFKYYKNGDTTDFVGTKP